MGHRVISYHGSPSCLKRLAPVWAAGLVIAIALPGVVMATASELPALVHVDADGRGNGLPDLAGAPPPQYAVEPFVLRAATSVEREQAIGCMTEAIYYEAGFEPAGGQRAVAQVILNRMRDRNFPSTVCGVIYQGWERSTGCQFSFVCDGSRVRRPPQDAQWARARRIAEQALEGHVETGVGTATHYHVRSIRPSWRQSLVRITEVGDHVFYRWPGNAGRPSALRDRYVGGEFDY